MRPVEIRFSIGDLSPNSHQGVPIRNPRKYSVTLGAVMASGIALALPQLAAASPSPLLGDPGLGYFAYANPSANDVTGVNVVTGNLLYATDLGNDTGIDSSTGPLLFSADYNSQQVSNQDFLSTGWSWSAGDDVYLDIGTSSITYYGPGGFVATYTQSSTGGLYTSTDTSTRLTVNQSGSGVTYTLTDIAGNTETFDSTGHELAATDLQSGVTTSVSVDNGDTSPPIPPMLQQVAIPGASLKVSYKSTTRLNHTFYSVTGLAGPSGGQSAAVSYSTNGDLSNLAFGTSGSNKIAYSYDDNHQMTKITEPDGTVETVTYAGNKAVKLLVTPPGSTSFGYTLGYGAPTSTCQTGDAGATTVTPIDPADGGAVVYCYTSAGVVDAQTATSSGGDISGGFTSPAGGATTAASSPSAITTPPIPVYSNTHNYPYTLSVKHHNVNASYRNLLGQIRISVYKDFSTGKFTRLSWAYDLSPLVLTRFPGFGSIDGQGLVDERAALFGAASGKKLGYSDAHVGKDAQAAAYTWHSIIPTVFGVTDGAAYQLVVAFYSNQCTPAPDDEGCEFNEQGHITFQVKN